MTSTKHSKVVREEFSSNLGPYFWPWGEFLTTYSTNKVYTCICFETTFNKRDYRTVGSYETHYAVSNSNFYSCSIPILCFIISMFQVFWHLLHELDRLLLSKSSPSPITSAIFWVFCFYFFFLHSKQMTNIWCKMYPNVSDIFEVGCLRTAVPKKIGNTHKYLTHVK